MTPAWALAPVIRLMERHGTGRSMLRGIRLLRSHRDGSRPRVLCIGYRKTGTTSFGRAMRQLGFSHYGYDRDLHAALERGDIERCLEVAERFDSLDDLPWFEPAFVSAFRKRFPGSSYVLLERDETEWLASYRAYYRTSLGAEECLALVRTHNTMVLHLLEGEPQLLRMNICAGHGYETLCPFLGVPHPGVAFPWANRGGR